MKYLIHTCNKRLWYVNDYLIPSMTEQGIDVNDVAVYLDRNEEGCLESCMKAFQSVENQGSTWHLQDDVIICSDFKKLTEHIYEEEIVCGYCYSKDDRKRHVGRVPQKHMWYSFPCINIPNSIAKGCAKWYFNHAKFANDFQIWIKMKKYDDSIFDYYLQTFYSNVTVLNLAPNLVDHIDYLIGGSVINRIRPEKETHAAYFEDTNLIDKLEKIIVDI